MTTTVFTSRAERFRLKRTEQKERIRVRSNMVESKNFRQLDGLQKSGSVVAVTLTAYATALAAAKPVKSAILASKNHLDGSKCKKIKLILAEREVSHPSCDSGDFLFPRKKSLEKKQMFFRVRLWGTNQTTLAIAA